MPHQYEAIRDSLMKRGKNPKKAKSIAAATFNKNRPKGAAPVTSSHNSSHKSLSDARRY